VLHSLISLAVPVTCSRFWHVHEHGKDSSLLGLSLGSRRAETGNVSRLLQLCRARAPSSLWLGQVADVLLSSPCTCDKRIRELFLISPDPLGLPLLLGCPAVPQPAPCSPLFVHSCPILVIMTQPAPGVHLGDSRASELVSQRISLCLRVAGFVYTFFYIGSTIGKEFYWHQIFLVMTKVSEQLN